MNIFSANVEPINVAVSRRLYITLCNFYCGRIYYENLSSTKSGLLTAKMNEGWIELNFPAVLEEKKNPHQSC